MELSTLVVALGIGTLFAVAMFTFLLKVSLRNRSKNTRAGTPTFAADKPDQ